MAPEPVALGEAEGVTEARAADGPTTGSTGLVWILVAAALLRLGALALLEPPHLHGDEGYYIQAARQLASGNGFPGSQRPPGFPAVVAAVFAVVGKNFTAARFLQIAISLAAIPLVFGLVRPRHGARAALLSSAVVAFHPTLVHYSILLWAEPLATTLLLLVLWLLDRFDRAGDELSLAAAGVALGAAVLVREMVVYFAAVVAAWAALRPPARPLSGTRRAAVVALSVAIIVLPWSARNWALHGRFVLVSTTRWMPVVLGNILPAGGVSLLDADAEGHDWFLPRYRASGNEIEREEFARRVALEAIAREQPWWLAKKIVRNGYLLWSPMSQLVRYDNRGWLPDRAVPFASGLIAWEAAWYVAATALGAAAIWLVPGGRTKPLVVVLILLHLAIYTFANANHRFRLPLLPLLALDTGPLLCGAIAADRRALRIAGAALTVLAFAAIVAIYYAHPELRQTGSLPE